MATAPQTQAFRIDLSQPLDRDEVTRDRSGRNTFVTVGTLLLWLGPTAFLHFAGGLLGIPFIGGIIGFILGTWLVKKLLPSRMLVFNPEWTAYVTQDPWTGKLIAYGPGAHTSYPWELRNKKGNYPLKTASGDISLTIPTQTAAVTLNGVFEYAMSLRHIYTALGMDPRDVEAFIRTFVQRFATSWCARYSADEVMEKIGLLNEELSNAFIHSLTGPAATIDLASRIGFKPVSVAIGTVTLPPAVQRTRDAIDEAGKLREVMLQMYHMTKEELAAQLQDGRISQERYQTMLNNAQVVSQNDTTKTIHAFEVNTPELAALLKAMLEKMAGGGTK